MPLTSRERTRKRHCMVVHAFYPVREPRVEREAKALVARGFEVDVICLRADGEAPRATQEGVTIYRLPVKRHRGCGAGMQLLEYLSFFVLAFAKLAVLHARRGYAVVQIHNLPDFLVFAGLIPKLAGARVILDIHDVMPEFYASRFKRALHSWPVRLVRWQEQLACRFADHVITVTEVWQTALIERGLPAHKVSVVMNIADDQVFRWVQPSALPARQEDTFRLIYHGTITERYGVDLAIRAVDLVRQTVPQVQLLIHGVGEFRDTVIRLTQELGLEQHVHFSTDFIPTPELPMFIRQADVGLVPYRRDVFTDGILPTKLLEYVAVGVPVIAADTAAIARYFDRSMVQFFAPGDYRDLARAILLLHADRERRVALAARALTFNQRYNWPGQAAGYVRLIEQLGQR